MHFRYGITAFGVVKAFTRIQLNGTSYFGTPAQLNTAVLNIGNLPSGNAATSVASFEAINSVIDNYVFRDGVRRDIVLISHKVLLLLLLIENIYESCVHISYSTVNGREIFGVL